MYSIRKSEFIRFKDETHSVSVIRAEIICDTAADLPAADALNEGELAQGSIAWDISTGDFYGLKSTGEWINQTAPAQSGAKSLTLSNQKGDKIEIEQPEEKELEILDIEDLEEKGEEENDEPVRDTESKKD